MATALKTRKPSNATSRDAPDSVLSYAPQGVTLRNFHRSDDFIRVMIGPLGSGKTQACIVEILLQIHNQVPDAENVRRSRWLCVRNTYPDLTTTTITDFRQVVDALGIGSFTNSNPPVYKIAYERLDGTEVDAEVIFRAFDHPDDQKRARGLQLSGLWCNELKELHRSNVDLVMSRVGRYPPKAQVPGANFSIICDSNAPDSDHWLAKLAITEKPRGWWFGIQPAGVELKGHTWIENPKAENLSNLPDGYYQKLVHGRPDAWIRQNLANEFVFYSDGRAVHPDFNEQIHVVECKPTAGAVISVGIDFGRTPAAAIMQRQANGQWYVLDELVTTNMGALRFGQLLHTHLNSKYPGFTFEFTGDPAGNQMAQTREETPFDMLLAAGIDAFPAPSNDFDERTESLDGLLRQLIDGQPAIVVDPSCHVLIRGLAGAYQFKRVQVAGADRFHDKPDKTPESHVCEALHYGLMGAGEGAAIFEQAFQKSYSDVESWAPPEHYFE